MLDDVRDPPEPDIAAYNNVHHPHHELTANTLHTARKSTEWTRRCIYGFLVLVICIACYTLPPTTTRDTSLHPHRRRSTPILSALKATLGWAATRAVHSAGFDLVPSPVASGLAKRESHHEHVVHIVEACMIPVCVALSGMFAGLTLGYFSVDPTQLQVLSVSGTEQEQEYARRILPVRKNSHLLLTTLILGNMIVNEALPVISDEVLGGGLQAVIISTALVVIFAEIIPQSVCSRYGLRIGASMAPVVRVLIVFFLPLAWPVAKLLEYMLGAHQGVVYRRAELRELIKIHASGAGGGGDLDEDTVTIAQGALDLAKKTVMCAMTSLEDAFMLRIDAKLDYDTLRRVLESGHSRIPVYDVVEAPAVTHGVFSEASMTTKIIGCLLVKNCILLDPDDATPLASIALNPVFSVPWDESLTTLLNTFQEGGSHLVVVSSRGSKPPPPPVVEVDAEALGSPTMSPTLGRRLRDKLAELHRSTSRQSDTMPDLELGKVATHLDVASDIDHASMTTHDISERPSTATAISPVFGVRTEDYDDTPDVPLGIVTLEDVLEELIGEEIYDEYDKGRRPSETAPSTLSEEVLPSMVVAQALTAASHGTVPDVVAATPTAILDKSSEK